MISEYVKDDMCCGCENCALVCPKNAIKMERDVEGFKQPVVDNHLCVQCSMCVNKCPIANPIDGKIKIQKNYYGYLVDDEQCERSASGGVAQAFYKYAVENAWVVYGVTYTDDFTDVAYRRIENKDITKLLGTKYSQASKNKIFCNVKKDLDEHKEVLFIGVQCEIAALIKYIGREYENLVTVQLVCMGVTSNKVFDGLKKELLGNNSKKIIEMRERFTKNNWAVPFIRIATGENTVTKPFDASYFAYVFNVFGRKSCYNCIYKGQNRVADISIGDFWGASKYCTKINKKGMSVISTHTDKGDKLVNSINIYLSEFDEAYNWHLYNPYAERSRKGIEKRNIFSKNFMEYNDTIKAAKLTMTKKERVKWLVARCVPGFVWTYLYELLKR